MCNRDYADVGITYTPITTNQAAIITLCRGARCCQSCRDLIFRAMIFHNRIFFHAHEKLRSVFVPTSGQVSNAQPRRWSPEFFNVMDNRSGKEIDLCCHSMIPMFFRFRLVPTRFDELFEGPREAS